MALFLATAQLQTLGKGTTILRLPIYDQGFTLSKHFSLRPFSAELRT